jgi:DNA mismatch repair protein MutL
MGRNKTFFKKMSKIKLLSESLANKIAAGEVVERPISVVKELVENSIDSNAKEISIIIKDAGKTLIQVIDNGIGMDEHDALLAFERHATSKIDSFSDVEKIMTMGFRGEALPSIAAVSQVELITKQKEDTVATHVLIDGSKMKNVGKTNGETGTSISIKNLFFNVPARKNFLKTNATEFSHILSFIKKIFLAYPEINFTFFNESEKMYDLSATTAEERIKDVLGHNYFTAMIPVDQSLGELHLTGFVLKPQLVKHSKGLQYIFINKRVVQSKFLNHAILKAYGEYLENGEYPGYCLYLNVSPKFIDVNVHPNKMEIKFSNDKVIYNFFMSAIQHSLNKNLEISDDLPDLGYVPITHQNESTEKNIVENTKKVLKTKKKTVIANQASLELSFVPKDQKVDKRLLKDHDSQTVNQTPNFWQLHDQYIFTQVMSGAVIIDQQLAHERILYERVMISLTDKKIPSSQQMLFPQTIELSREDYEKFEDIEEELLRIGFSVKKFGGRTIVIDAVPGDVKIRNEAGLFLDILNECKKMNIEDPVRKVALAFSKCNSIKIGEKLTQDEMHALMDQLFATSSPYFSENGKKIIIQLDLDEINKKFKK